MSNDWTDIFRDKLAECTETPPENLWQDIESKLALCQDIEGKLAKQRHKSLRLWLFATAACAAIVLGLAIIADKHSAKVTPSVQTAQVISNNPNNATTAYTATTNSQEQTPEQPKESTSVAKAKKPITETSVKSQIEDKTASQKADTEAETAYTTTNSVAEETNEETEPEKSVAEETNNETEPKTTSSSLPTERKALAKNLSAPSSRKGATHSAYTFNLYAANIGFTTDNFNNNTNYIYSTGDIGSMNSTTLPLQLKTRIKDSKHKQPLRLGISFSYPINNRLNINAGVVFSRLSSKVTFETYYTEDVVIGEYTKTFEHTNIGIPAGVTYRLIDYQPLYIYLTAGCMMEKCVSGDEKRLQLSLFGGAGLQLSLSDLISLYAEPVVTHYPDNHSDAINIYKDTPTNIELRIGLRMKLNKSGKP